MFTDLATPRVGPRQTPMHLRWRGQLPRRLLRALGAPKQAGQPTPAAHPFPPPAWLATGSLDQPFDFSGHVTRLLADMVQRCSFFSHVRVPQILVGALQARTGQTHGLQARVTPLRFRAGQLTRQRRGVQYQVQRYFLDDQEFLYLMTFCLPRFLNQEFDDKLVTIVHETYHIGPLFDGDLRRHQGRCHLHTHSQKKYDRHMADLARAYLATRPDPNLLAFLRLDFAQLVARHGAVEGIVVPRPRMIPIPT